MKAKLLWVLLIVIPFGVSVAATNHKRKAKYSTKEIHKKYLNRLPFNPSIQVIRVNNALQLTFQYSLLESYIVIKDKDGNEVIDELQTTINEGKLITISDADAYPYSIEITSPTVDIWGEIVLEE